MDYYSSFITVVIFCFILFIYLHIFFHIKTSNELELYEIEPPSKIKLHEICDLKQPVLFDFTNEYIDSNINRKFINDSYGGYDVNIRDVNETDDELYIQLPYNISHKLFINEKEKKYFMENNYSFLKETRLIKHFQAVDDLLRPNMVSECNYDIICGTDKATTPLRYSLDNRMFFYSSEDNIKIRLIPPTYGKHLNIINDYVNFEFRSNINPWNVNNIHKIDYDKCRSFDVTVNKGQIIFIPSYWFYSIEMTDKSNILKFSYKTYMNTVSILPQLVMSLLQQNNVKRTENKSSEKIVSLVEKIDISNNIIDESNDLNAVD